MSNATLLRAALLLSAAIAPATAHALSDDGDAEPNRPDIVVTGQLAQESATGSKTDAPPIETPQSLSIITSDRFEAMGAQSVQDTLRYVAGVRTEAYGLDTRGDYGYVRGSEFPVYQDGLRRSFGYRQGSKAEIFTLQQVEVLRGPASMLYGAGPAGGLVNLTSKAPRFEFGAEAFVSYGTFDRKEAGIDVTGPIIGDVLAGRLVALWRDADSQTDFVGERRWTINPSLTLQLGADTSLTVTGLVQDDDSGWTGQFLPYVGTLRPTADGRRLDWSAHLGEPSTDRVDLNSEWVSARFVHRFSDAISFRQSVRYEWFRSRQFLHYANVYDNPTAPYVDPADPYLQQYFPSYAALGSNRVLNRYAFGEDFRSRTLSTDSQFQFDVGTRENGLKLLFGMDYARYRSRGISAFGYSGPSYDEDGNFVPPSTTPIDAFNPVFGNIIDLPWFDDPDTRQSQLGLYVQAQARLFDILILIGGVRRDRAVNEAVGISRIVDEATTARAGAMLELPGGFVPYVSYSESFLPIEGSDFAGNPFKPQRGRQYEAGVKWQPDPGTLVTVAAYDMIDRNRLASDPTNPLNSIQTGVVATKGFEFEASKTIVDDLDLVATYTYTRAKDRQQANQQFESVPRHLASIWGTKRFQLGGGFGAQFGAGVRYVGKSVSTSFDANGDNFPLFTPDYVAVDALFGIDKGPWTFRVNASSLLDKKYYATCLGRGDCFLGMRRTVDASLAYRF